MTTKVLGNNLTFKTFNYLKVNNVEIELPKSFGKDYYIKSDEILDIDEFKDFDYGVSKEVIEMNMNLGNLYKSYISKEGMEVKEHLLLNQDNDYNTLLDTHDLIAEKSSILNIVLDYKSRGETDKFRNSIIRLLAMEDSEVNIFIIQEEDKNTISLESILLEIGRNALVNVYQFQLGAKKLYTNLQANLRGEDSKLNIDSIYFAYDSNELNMLYNICHYGVASISDLLVNGALKDNSYKNFKSSLDFKKGCSFASGSEEEYAILLDDNAVSISVPSLLAGEDNVEGAHAANAGKIDEDLKFYIMTRGLSESQAESLIIQSRFAHVIDKFESRQVRDRLWKRVADIVKGEVWRVRRILYGQT